MKYSFVVWWAKGWKLRCKVVRLYYRKKVNVKGLNSENLYDLWVPWLKIHNLNCANNSLWDMTSHQRQGLVSFTVKLPPISNNYPLALITFKIWISIVAHPYQSTTLTIFSNLELYRANKKLGTFLGSKVIQMIKW